jgi:uncharacterized protein YutE (UPF0331/DUF86 family)
MVDRDKIEGLFRHLQRYTAYLREIAEQERPDFLRDPKSIGSARYYLQVSIEACISIANHIIATERLRSPKDYKDSFQVLHEAGILPADVTRTMRELAGLRNLLVHLYWDVDDEMIYAGISTELADFEAFVRCILDFLDQSASRSGP